MDTSKVNSNTNHLDNYNRSRAVQSFYSFCYAPFSNLYFARNGDVIACCHNRKHVLGHYPAQSIRDIWWGAPAKELRERLKKDDLSLGCEVCKSELLNGNYQEVKARHFDQMPLDEHYPTMMEFELDNTCNLECTMCSGEFSSLIRKNREKKPPIQSKYGDEFAGQLIEFIPYLHMARFSGGEPFLIDLYFKIWEEIITNNPACLISVQSNGTVLNNRVKDILERGRFEIGLSIDSLQKETYENIRLNAKYERMMENLSFFADYCKRKNTPFRLSVCAMRENWQELPHYVDYANKKSAYVNIHRVVFPQEKALYNLPADELEKIHLDLASAELPSGGHIEATNQQHYREFVNQVKAWHEEAIRQEQFKVAFGEKGIPELIETVKGSIEQEITQDHHLQEAEKTRKIDHCLNRLETILNEYPADGQLRSALIRMAASPMDGIISSLWIDKEPLAREKARRFILQLDDR